MQGKCSTLTTAQNAFKLPMISNPSSANMLMSNALIMSYHIFKYFSPLPNLEINTTHTIYREEREWITGSWFKWANPILNSRGWGRNVKIEKRMTYSSSSILDTTIIWPLKKKKDVLICWEEYISSGRRFGDLTMNNNEVSRVFCKIELQSFNPNEILKVAGGGQGIWVIYASPCRHPSSTPTRSAFPSPINIKTKGGKNNLICIGQFVATTPGSKNSHCSTSKPLMALPRMLPLQENQAPPQPSDHCPSSLVNTKHSLGIHSLW